LNQGATQALTIKNNPLQNRALNLWFSVRDAVWVLGQEIPGLIHLIHITFGLFAFNWELFFDVPKLSGDVVGWPIGFADPADRLETSLKRWVLSHVIACAEREDEEPEAETRHAQQPAAGRNSADGRN
jgi:hypothetical protein